MHLLALFSLLSSPAGACPTVATGTSSPLSFDVAQVAIVRQANRTTFSVSINPAGDPQEFALVLPVPEVLEQDEIQTLDPLLFATLDGFTAPRHVSDAGCYSYGYPGSDADESDTGGAGGGDGSVDVEAEYLVGEYQITILSAEESTGLQTWLDTNGYFLPDGAEPMLAEYIDAGSYFLAAKVAEGAAVADGTPLSPLQIAYDSEMFAIPIRLATLNSPGEQDMVIYAITDYAGGRVGISNYAEFDVPDRCIWGDPSTDSFGSFYQDLYEETWAAQGDAAWTVEFAGAPYECNPCTNVWLQEEQIQALGFVGYTDDSYVTRLRMRYTPAQADEDLSLYSSGIHEAEVTAFADDYAFNYDCVESFCDGTPTSGGGPGGGGDDTSGLGGSEGGSWADGDDEPKEGGCGSRAALGLFGLAAGLAALRRRR